MKMTGPSILSGRVTRWRPKEKAPIRFIQRNKPGPSSPCQSSSDVLSMSSGTATTNTESHNPFKKRWVVLPTISLSDFYDVTLLLGQEEQPVRANITALRLSSEVWNAMYGGSWAESGATEVRFPDDDVAAMLIVLRIAHMKFSDLPKEGRLEFRELVNLALVCDKYDVVHLVRPFLDSRGWAPSYTLFEFCGDGWLSWLFVTWTFGYLEDFTSLARDATKRIEIEGDGSLSYRDYEVFASYMPPDILESILNIRKQTISKLLDSVYKILDKAIAQSVCQEAREDKSDSTETATCFDCSLIILGSLLSQAIDLGLYPSRRDSSDIGTSIDSLWRSSRIQPANFKTHDLDKIITSAWNCSRYDGMDAKRREKTVEDCSFDHKSCVEAFSLNKQFTRIWITIPSPVLESHIRHIQEQAKK